MELLNEYKNRSTPDIISYNPTLVGIGVSAAHQRLYKGETWSTPDTNSYEAK